MFGIPVEIGVSIIGLIGILLVPFAKIIAQKVSNVRSIDEEAEISRNVNAELINLKHEYGAMRVFINQYHNGGKFYSGLSRQKLSMTFETYDENKTHSILPKFQDLPITYFSSMVYDLNKDGLISQDTLESIKDSSFRRILKEENVYSHYAFAVYKTIWHLKWHPIFFRRRSVMIASIHLYFDKDTELSEINRVSLSGRARVIGKLLT